MRNDDLPIVVCHRLVVLHRLWCLPFESKNIVAPSISNHHHQERQLRRLYVFHFYTDIHYICSFSIQSFTTNNSKWPVCTIIEHTSAIHPSLFSFYGMQLQFFILSFLNPSFCVMKSFEVARQWAKKLPSSIRGRHKGGKVDHGPLTFYDLLYLMLSIYEIKVLGVPKPYYSEPFHQIDLVLLTFVLLLDSVLTSILPTLFCQTSPEPDHFDTPFSTPPLPDTQWCLTPPPYWRPALLVVIAMMWSILSGRRAW